MSKKYGEAGIVDYGEVVYVGQAGDMAVVGWYGTLFHSWNSALEGFEGFKVMDFTDAFNLNWAIALGRHEYQYHECYRAYRKLYNLTPEQEETIWKYFHYLKGVQ